MYNFFSHPVLYWNFNRFFLPIIVPKERVMGKTILKRFNDVLKDSNMFNNVEMLLPQTQSKLLVQLPLGFALAIPEKEFRNFSLAEVDSDYGKKSKGGGVKKN